MEPRRIPGAIRRKRASQLKPVFLACILLLIAVPVLAQSAATYDLTWWTVDGGGGTSGAGNSYSLTGTAGQPVAGLVSGGTFTLTGGFWPGGAVALPENMIYLPVVVRNH